MQHFAIITEWFFDPSYSGPINDRLETHLKDYIASWVAESCSKLGALLARHPDQKTASLINGGRTPLVVSGQPVHILCLLICDRSGPIQCAIYVGGKELIVPKYDTMRTEFDEQLLTSGITGLIVEKAPRD